MKSFVHNGYEVKVDFDTKNQDIKGKYKTYTKAFELCFHCSLFSESVKITHFKVDENIREMGLGTIVLSKFEEWAKEMGFIEITGDLVKNKEYSLPEDLVEFYKSRAYKIKHKNKNKGMLFATFSKSLIL